MDFREFFKGPDAIRRTKKLFAWGAKPARRPDQWTDEEIEDTLRRYIFEPESYKDRVAYEGRQALNALRDETDRLNPILLRMLADSDMRRQFLESASGQDGKKPNGGVQRRVAPLFGFDLIRNARTPFTRLCEYFGNCSFPEVLGLLEPFLTSESPDVRAAATQVIARTGLAEAVEPMRRALADEHESVRSAVVSGLGVALRDGRVDPACVWLFDDLKARLFLEDSLYFQLDNLYSVLLALDERRAIAYFMSEEMTDPASGGLRHALRALWESRALVPPESMAALLNQATTGVQDYGDVCVLDYAARLLGIHRRPEDRPLFESLMDFSSPLHESDALPPNLAPMDVGRVRAGAADAWLSTYRLEGVLRGVWDYREAHSNRSPLQKYIDAVYELDADVCNGGFQQYFFNTGGVSWKDALVGFSTMGMIQRTALLRRAGNTLGPGGPAAQRSQFDKLVAALSDEANEALQEIDSEYYQCDETIAVHAARYVVANQNKFR